MKRAKKQRPGEQRLPIIFPSVPIQTLRAVANNYFAFRRVDYHFRQDYKSIFLGFNEYVMQSRQGRQLASICGLTFLLRPTLRRLKA